MAKKKTIKVGTISGTDILKKSLPPQDIPFRTGWDKTDKDRPRKSASDYAEDIRYCGECRHYQMVDPKTIKVWPTGEPVYDCPYATDWCEAEYEANTLCDGRFEEERK